MSDFPVVGIGGSAGGLEAFEALFRALAPDTGAAFVVIQHLKADQPSQLHEILGRCTAMPVTTATQGGVLQPNHVYVVSPGRELELADDQLRLVEPKTPHHPPAAIDRFFRSLAKARGPRAIGVVFSGMGDDGTLGLKSIKQAGGVVLVQDPATAAFDSMPRSAIATHMADDILDVEGIADALQSYILRYDAQASEYDSERLTPVLELLRQSKNHDFSGYKRPMLSRRVRRRMHLAGLGDLDKYVQLLGEKPAEIERLHRDLLISVTDFFRDPEAYTALQAHALPNLPSLADRTQPVRAWVPACATGEEAYTIAILLNEAMRAKGDEGDIHVFASDIDDKALDIARVGVYPENITADVPSEYMPRYFTKTDHHYQISNELRQGIVFAAQDLLRDPPYSRLDLISCRNLMIYLSPDVQKYVLTLFHFALRDGGFLFLGNAETIGQADDLFEPVDARHRIYRRIAGAAREQRPFPFVRRGEKNSYMPSAATQRQSRATDADQIAQQLLLRDYVPACVLINRKAEVLCAYGPTQRYLALPIGAFKQDLMEMAADDLRHKLRAVTYQAIRENSRQQVSALRDSSDDGGARSVQISARPLQRPASARGLLLVTFEDVPTPTSVVAAEGDEATVENRFAEELRATQDELQSTIQSLEATNEDLQGSNEEIMSMNEEFQSTNEELETSKEELQSLNEELNTVNSELRSKVGDLERLNKQRSRQFVFG